MADLAEIKAMIEAALPGAEVEVVDETLRRSSRASHGSTSTGWSSRR